MRRWSLRGVRTAGHQVFLGGLALVLLGYMYLGRGFAYLGLPPLFIGEVVLLVGLATLMLGGIRFPRTGRLLLWVLLAYMLWGAALTAADLPEFGLLALRDGVVWGYGLFAVLVAVALSSVANWPERVVALLRWPYAVLVVWIPVLWATLRWMPQLNVDLVDGIALLQVKPGDMGVHLAAAAAFFGLGLGATGARQVVQRRWSILEWVWWVIWWAAAGLVSVSGRGGLLAIVVASVLLPIARRSGPWLKGLVAGLTLLMAALLLDVRIEIGHGGGRVLSVSQIVRNVASISLMTEADPSLTGTVRWRLDWWSKIIDYTVRGEHFWTGKGFGVNLAESDDVPRAGAPGPGLRSPHNIHMTVLARMGVPGAALWAIVQVMFVVSVARSIPTAKRAFPVPLRFMPYLILVYWLAAMINATFDVYLEGPQGGIWFWTVFGVGLAWLGYRRPPAATGTGRSGT